jgi:nucleoside-diphosphate-sugar epimerase
MYGGVDRRDVAEAHLRAVAAPVRGSTTVNIAGPSPFAPDDVGGLWDDPWPVIERRAPGVRAGIEQRGWPLPGRIDRVYAIEKAGRVLGYAPRYGIAELLRQVAA